MTPQDRGSEIERYEPKPGDDPRLIVLAAVRDGQLGIGAINDVIESWQLGLIGSTSDHRGAVEALQRIERLPRKWEATPTGDRAPWAAVGSEAHKIAADYLKRGR